MEDYEIEDPDNTFRALMDQLNEEMGHLGIYVETMSIVGAPSQTEEGEEEFTNDLNTEQIVDRIKDEQGKFGIALRGKVGDLAWDERTLDPERFAQETEEKILLPTEEEMIRADIKEYRRQHGTMEGWIMPDIFKIGKFDEGEDSLDVQEDCD